MTALIRKLNVTTKLISITLQRNFTNILKSSFTSPCTVSANCIPITRLHPNVVTYNTVRHKSRKDEDSDEENEYDGDTTLSKDSKVVKFEATSLRADLILKSALGIARNKIEQHFYESKVRVNGKKLLKKSASDPSKKYFKRGELLAKEEEEYFKKHGPKLEEIHTDIDASKDKDKKVENKEAEQTESILLSRSEVIKRLRERGHPILLFAESELQSFKRLRRIEIQEPEANRGFRNDFQEAMEKVDQAYLDEILTLGTQNDHEKGHKEDDLDDSVTYDFIQDMAKTMGQGDRNHDMAVIMTLLQFLLKMWGNQLNSATAAEKTAIKHKMTRATYTQTRVYLKPLMRKLKKKSLPEDICDSLTEITKHLLERNYIMASDAYLQMAIGNAPWPIGVTMVGIHARTGREKIFSKNVAHVMNDETQRKYIQALKRLMTKCQEYFPTDPSRCVEYSTIR